MRRDLVERSLDLGRMLRRLLPEDPAVAGLLALLLLTDARRETRTGPDGRLLLLEEQDRSRWDTGPSREGAALVREALRHRPPGRYALQAAIAAVHAESPTWNDTDWHEIVALYGVLGAGLAVAGGRAQPRGGGRLRRRGRRPGSPRSTRWPASRSWPATATCRQPGRTSCAGSGRVDEARAAYEEALQLTGNAVERDFLAGRLGTLAAGREG